MKTVIISVFFLSAILLGACKQEEPKPATPPQEVKQEVKQDTVAASIIREKGVDVASIDKNKDGKVVFGVYQGGVRIYVEDSPTIKGAKGGFAVGGLTNQGKAVPYEYMRITSDSARIYINDI